MAVASISQREFGRRYRKSLSMELNFEQACSPSILQFVNSYSKAIGCNEKSIFFPLLTCCAACMGPNSCIELVPDWREPPVVWTMVITPTTLTRIDIAEHLKQQLLAVITNLSVKSEDGPPLCNKIIVDDIDLEVLLDTMKCNDGQAVAIYNNTRVLHNIMSSAKDVEVIRRLHNGSSWFSSLKQTKKLLSKTHMNFAVLACPDAVQNSLASCPNFQEVFSNCFLTICAEENHVKFSQLSTTSQSDLLQKIFKEIIILHSTNSIVYKLSTEGKQKFSQIHDEITDKSKQLARKSEYIFSPILSYLGRLSCILHVLDNAIDAINCCVPIDFATWSSEISADTVWKARQVLGYVIEQKFVLSQPSIVPSTSSSNSTPPVTVDDLSPQRGAGVRCNLFQNRSPTFVNRTPTFTTNRAPFTNNNATPVYQYNTTPGRYTPRRRMFNTPTSTPTRTLPTAADQAFDLLLSNTTINNNLPLVSQPVMVDPVKPILPLRSDTAFSLPNGGGNTASVSNDLSNKTLVTPQSVALMNNDEFFKTFKVHIRRLVMHEMKEISLTQCIEMKFAPKHSGENPTLDQKTAMARIFLKRLETLGFGLCDSSNGIASRQIVFKKRPFKTLSDAAKQHLSNLRVNEREYDKCFVKQPVAPGANGVVCLE